MALIRWLLGKLILAWDGLTSPASPQHTPEIQANLDSHTAALALYQFHACPFCVKVRRAIKRLGLNIELRDAKNNTSFRQELLEQGGRIKVPCLRIAHPDGQIQWLYESDDIISYLEQHFTR